MLRSKFASLREYLTPVNHESNFASTGQISPEEFVLAGDYLTYKFPTWQWAPAPENLRKLFLPSDNQFLVTRHVPSYQRVAAYLGTDVQEDEDDVDGWVKSRSVNAPHTPQNDPHDIDDMIDDTAEDPLDEEDGFQQIESAANNHLRRYDLYITYSTSYRVPKLYLVGFDANGIPLLPNQMFEDISNDYKDKTATIEQLPVTYNTTSVSIHPCRHSLVMKVLMKHAVRSRDGEEKEGVRVDQYLVIFLKFIASVTPGIEYDYTMDAL